MIRLQIRTAGGVTNTLVCPRSRIDRHDRCVASLRIRIHHHRDIRITKQPRLNCCRVRLHCSYRRIRLRKQGAGQASCHGIHLRLCPLVRTKRRLVRNTVSHRDHVLARARDPHDLVRRGRNHHPRAISVHKDHAPRIVRSKRIPRCTGGQRHAARLRVPIDRRQQSRSAVRTTYERDPRVPAQ